MFHELYQMFIKYNKRPYSEPSHLPFSDPPKFTQIWISVRKQTIWQPWERLIRLQIGKEKDWENISAFFCVCVCVCGFSQGWPEGSLRPQVQQVARVRSQSSSSDQSCLKVHCPCACRVANRGPTVPLKVWCCLSRVARWFVFKPKIAIWV
jgi:hypothetical protein